MVVVEKGLRLGRQTKNVFDVITSKWPANPLEVAQELGETGATKSISAKYLYHFKKLKDIGLINMKKIGNTYIAWPNDMEKLRLIHELLRE